jgi:hypothetical protein
MRHKRNLARRSHTADIKEVVAIALGGEVLDRSRR